MFLLLNALYTNEEKHFGAHSFCVAKSNANQNLHVLLKYLRFTNSFIKSSNAGQHRTNRISLSRERDRQSERDRERQRDRQRHRETGRETETERNREDRQRHTESERHTGLPT